MPLIDKLALFRELEIVLPLVFRITHLDDEVFFHQLFDDLIAWGNAMRVLEEAVI